MANSIFDLSGKTAVVIGGTTGIGHAISLGFADAGADVIASSRRTLEVTKTAEEIRERGRRTLELTSDVKSRDSIIALRDGVLAEFGKVDILVNCAGTTKRAPTLNFPEADWANIMETNLTGTLRGCQVFGEAMLAAGYGRIINIASLSTFVALFEVAAYAASKAAVGSLTKSLAVEWSRFGVNVNAIAPGVFRTDLNANLLDNSDRGREFLLRTPMRRFGKTEELVGAAIYLASDAASFVAGEIITVDGGFMASGVNQ
jgi:NAD(P)-dependent dehydrogenase (short-subunit alcohol dehydrogenase family)